MTDLPSATPPAALTRGRRWLVAEYKTTVRPYSARSLARLQCRCHLSKREVTWQAVSCPRAAARARLKSGRHRHHCCLPCAHTAVGTCSWWMKRQTDQGPLLPEVADRSHPTRFVDMDSYKRYDVAGRCLLRACINALFSYSLHTPHHCFSIVAMRQMDRTRALCTLDKCLATARTAVELSVSRTQGSNLKGGRAPVARSPRM